MKMLESSIIINHLPKNGSLATPSNSPSFFKFINIQSSRVFLSKLRFLDLALKILSLKCFLLRCIFFTGLFSVFTRVAVADSEVSFDDNSFYNKGSDLIHSTEDKPSDDEVVADNVNFNSDYYNILANNQNYSGQNYSGQNYSGQNIESKDDSSSKTINEGFKHLVRIGSGGKISSKRNIGNGEILVPIYQTKDGDQLLFTDIRGRFDNLGSSEYNVGIGYRKLLNDTSFLGQNQWIVGAYGFFDHLTSSNKNNFNQATFGIESLSNEFDFRTNIYIPQNKEATISSAVDTNSSNGRVSINYKKEKPLKGSDFEVGYRLPITFAKTKIFAGGYYYKGDGNYKSIAGSKYRAEITFDRNNTEMLPKNMEITFGSEYQYDKVRGQKLFGALGLSYQFGVFDNANSIEGGDIRSRMNEFLIRDIDVVTNKGEFNEKAFGEIYGIGNREVYYIDSTHNLKTTIENAPNNSLIILDGSKGDFIIEAQTELKPGQVISGQRDSLLITAGGIGKSFSVTLSTNRARLVTNNDLSNNHLIGMNDNTEIENLDIYFDAGQGQKYLASGSARIINVDGKSNVVINKVGMTSNYYDVSNNNSLQKSDATAVYVNNSRNVTIIGNNSNSQSDISGYKNAVEINNAKGSVDISGLNTSNNKGVGIMISNSENVNLNNINSNHNLKGIAVNDSGIANLIGQVNTNNNSDSGIEITNVNNLNNYSNLNANYNQNGVMIDSTRVNNFATLNANNNEIYGVGFNKVDTSNFGLISANNNQTGLYIINANDLFSNSINTNGNKVGIDIYASKNINLQKVNTNNNETEIRVDNISLQEVNLFN